MPAAGLAYDPILFDLDGTLTDSAPGIRNCLRHALAELGHPGLPDAELAAFLGPPLADSFTRYCGFDDEQVAAAIAAYRSRFTSVGMFENSLYPGVEELLDELLRAGATLAVATSKPEEFAARILAHFGIADRFKIVVGAELDGRRSAKSEVVAEALRRLSQAGVPISGRPTPGGPNSRGGVAAVMVGDRSHDVLGAAANGLACIGVGWGYAEPGELAGAGAIAVVADPPQLANLLLGTSGLPDHASAALDYR